MVRALDDNRIYTIKLRLDPFCEDENVSQEKLQTFLTDKARVYDVVESSLFGYEILAWSIKRHIFRATIQVNREQKTSITGSQTVKEDLVDNYGERACDTWMEGDTIIGQIKEAGEDSADLDYDGFVTLEISLLSIHTGDRLSKKRSSTAPESTQQKRQKT